MRDSARRKRQQRDPESEEQDETMCSGLEFLEEVKRRVPLPVLVDNVNNRVPDTSLSLLSK